MSARWLAGALLLAIGLDSAGAAEPTVRVLRERAATLAASAEPGSAPGLFGAHRSAPTGSAPDAAAGASPAPAAPTVPVLPFSFLGKKLQDGVWEVYLARGEHTLAVRAGSVIDASYRVGAITPSALTLIYIPLNHSHTLATGDFN